MFTKGEINLGFILSTVIAVVLGLVIFHFLTKPKGKPMVSNADSKEMINKIEAQKDNNT